MLIHRLLPIYLPVLLCANVKAEMHITPLTRPLIPALHQMFTEVWNEIFDLNYSTTDYAAEGLLAETEHFETEYHMLLVLLDGTEVVGSGGIKPFNDTICELKRMWFRKSYRGQGWGSKILQQLLDEARNRKFEYMRLEVFKPDCQMPAIQFYRKFGFYEIAPYNHREPGILCMEKCLR